MLRLVAGDLIANARIWLGLLLIAAATGAVGAVAASDIQTAVETGGTVALALYAISGTMIAFTTITALIVAGSVAGLTVALQQRAYALWQLVGVRPAYVRLVVTSQLALVASIGGVLGCLAVVPALGPLYRYGLAGSPDLAGLHPDLGAPAAVPVVLFVTVVMTLAGSRSAGRAARTPPIQSLHETDRPDQRMNGARATAGLVLLAIVAAVVASLPGTAPDQLPVPLMLIAPLTAGVLAVFAPLYLSRLLDGWTAVVPERVSSSWYLARRSTAFGVARNTAAISPITVAVALAGGLYSATGTATGGGSVTTGSVVLLLGGPLLLALLGATATIFMSSRHREREFALLVAAGATRGVVLAAAAWEAVIHTVTATILGAAAVCVTAVAGGWATGTWTPSFGPGAVATVAAAGLLLTLAATVLPTAVVLRHELPQTLAAQ
jgi:putative ABC transport system permease protein